MTNNMKRIPLILMLGPQASGKSSFIKMNDLQNYTISADEIRIRLNGINSNNGYPQINFVGIERYSSVLLRAVEKFDTDEFKELENVRFICIDARRIEEVFAKDEVDRIYLNFSDPWPKARHAKRRLTSTEFLERYQKVLVPFGRLEFKTDNTELFNFSLEQMKEAGWTLQGFTYDLHHNEEMNSGNIMTEYEEKFSGKGNPINKLIAVRK